MNFLIMKRQTVQRVAGWAQRSANAMRLRAPVIGAGRRMAGSLRARTTCRDPVDATAIVIGCYVHVRLLLLLFVERCLSSTRGMGIEHREVDGDFKRLSQGIGTPAGQFALTHPDDLIFH